MRKFYNTMLTDDKERVLKLEELRSVCYISKAAAFYCESCCVFHNQAEACPVCANSNHTVAMAAAAIVINPLKE